MPAAAVIPAPIAYIKIAVVKKLVVGFLLKHISLPSGYALDFDSAFSWGEQLHLIVWFGTQGNYFEEIRVLPASVCLVYKSME